MKLDVSITAQGHKDAGCGAIGGEGEAATVDVGDELIDCEAEDKAHSAAQSGSKGWHV